MNEFHRNYKLAYFKFLKEEGISLIGGFYWSCFDVNDLLLFDKNNTIEEEKSLYWEIKDKVNRELNPSETYDLLKKYWL